jgi:hypothetical protein
MVIGEQKAMFQLCSSWARFLRSERFVRLDYSISCLFSTSTDISTPPAAKEYVASHSWSDEAPLVRRFRP